MLTQMLIDVIVGSHTVIMNTASSLIHFAQFPTMVT